MTTAERAPDPRPPIWPVFVAFAAAITIAQVVGGVVLGVMFVVTRFPTPETLLDPDRLGRALVAFVTSPSVIIAGAAASSITLAGTALVGARVSKTPAALRLRLGPGRLGAFRTAVAALGVVGVSWAWGSLVSLAGLDGIGLLHLFDKAFKTATPGFLALAVLFIGLCAPLGEELFFRGYMQTRLAQRWRRAVAIGLTGFLFGLMHMDPIQAPYAMLVGFYLGWLVEVAGSIRPAILAHALNNCLSVIGARYLGEDASGPSVTSNLVTLAIGLAVLGGAVLTLRTAPPHPAAADQPVP